MFSKNNTLPFVLALLSTLAVLGLGLGALKMIAPSTTASETANSNPKDVAVTSSSKNLSKATPAVSFSAPGIVPMGISVKINGSDKMEKTNKLLKASFQQEFPGTAVNIDTDGSEAGMRLLLSGQVDLAAVSRPLSEDELAKGLTAVTIEGKHLEEAGDLGSQPLLYAYREPANIKVEAFLGHLFSAQGQNAIIDR